MPRLRRQGKLLTWKKAVLLLAACGAAVAVSPSLFRHIKRERARARQAIQTHDLTSILFLLATYEDVKGCLPEAVHCDVTGHPLCSWRFRTSPCFLEGFPVQPNFGVRWDHPDNGAWKTFAPALFCWSLPESARGIGMVWAGLANAPTKLLETNVVAVTGPGTAFDSNKRHRLADLPPNTILVVGIGHSGIHWMEPGDLTLDNIPPSITSGFDGTGVCVAFADRNVWFLRPDVPVEDLKKFFTIEGAREHDRDIILRPFLIRPQEAIDE